MGPPVKFKIKSILDEEDEATQEVKNWESAMDLFLRTSKLIRIYEVSTFVMQLSITSLSLWLLLDSFSDKHGSVFNAR